MSLYQTLSSCQGGDSGLSESLQNVRMTALLKDTGLKFYYPDGTVVPLMPTVQCQSADGASTSTPSGLEELEQATGFKLEQIGYDTGTYLLNKTCREKIPSKCKFSKFCGFFCSVNSSCQAFKFHSTFDRPQIYKFYEPVIPTKFFPSRLLSSSGQVWVKNVKIRTRKNSVSGHF